jgi:4-alpha-glucanotransferase
MATRSSLRALADDIGIIPEYVDQTGRERRKTSDETRVALLAALGIDASTEDRAAEALASRRAHERAELVPPVHVVAEGDAAAAIVRVRAPATSARDATWRLEIITESGGRHSAEGTWRGRSIEAALPVSLPLGYHDIHIALSAGRREWHARQRRIVVPEGCALPRDVLDGDRAFGIVANLYAVRGRRDWGVGDFGDLGRLAEWAAAQGADFVGVNPLHAVRNRGGDVSPYNPVSRLFKNPIYVDVCAVPELDQAPEVRERIASEELQAELSALRESADVRYAQVMAVKGLALDALHRVFRARANADPANPRVRAYTAYVTAHEPALTKYAAFMGGDSPERADYHRWLQFELDRQLGAAAARARDAGMRIGLYPDLAIGSAGDGADARAYPELFVRGVSVGSPPDPYAATGQNWGFPPINPHALRRSAYAYFVQLLRSGFRHAGALRIDHVMGLFRLFWIPEGDEARNGAYVRYPSSDLLGILALESRRHGALVVGEDLGTVPRDVPPALRKWGVLSSKV